MRALSSCALLLPFIASCAAPPPPPPRLAPEGVSQVEAACRGLDAVDLSRIPRAAPDWSRFDRFHRLARDGMAAPDEGTGTRLRLAIPGGSIPAPYGLSVWAARQADGAWRVSHVRYLQLPPPPQPPGAAPLAAPQPRIVTTGRLKPQAAALIEAALASDCLGREPFMSPATLPMKNGADMPCPPDGGGGNALEIIRNGTTRRYLRECGRTWASGAIIIALENPDNLIRD